LWEQLVVMREQLVFVREQFVVLQQFLLTEAKTFDDQRVILFWTSPARR
jgi:hypothetical protein